VVEFDGAGSTPVNLALTSASPGIFTVPGQVGRGTVINSSSGRLNSATDPARPGEVVTIYFTGTGTVTNQPASGAAAPSSPLARCQLPAAVLIGGRVAEVLFCGLAPGFAGLGQVNARVPADASSGEVTLELLIGGSAGDAVRFNVVPGTQGPGR